MPGGYGGTDIWKSTLEDTGWAAPVNLGPLLNTVGDELFPSVQSDGNLFFSSDGHGGAGGLDLFMARATPSGWGDVRRLPAPINSPGDDFSYTLNADGRSGYFSSDREGGEGLDDVYAFSIHNPTLAGQVLDMETEASLSGAMITVTETESGEIERMLTHHEGRFGMVLQPEHDYLVRISRDGYLDQVFKLDTREKKQNLRQTKTVLLAQPQLVVDGIARDQKTGYALSGVEIILAPGDRSTWSALGGIFHFDLEPGGEYKVEARRPGYRPAQLKINADVKAGTHRIPVELEMVPDVGHITLQGQVLDVAGNPIEGADLFLINREELEEVTAVSGPNGTYSFLISPKQNYQLVARSPGYQTSQEQFEAPALRHGVLPKNIRLTAMGEGRATAFKSIYYDYGESLLRGESLKELDRLATMLKMNEERRIVISSSTDSRGSADYNLNLSQRRAEAVARYLISKGVDKERVEAIGYGETRMINDCENGVPCTEEQHQANRRTEFTLLPGRKTSAKVIVGRTPVASRPAQDGHYPPLDVGEPACYRVQIGIFDSPNKADVAIRLGEKASESLQVVPVDTALFRYQLGECEIYADAKTMYAKALDAGFEGAFIAAYQEGKRVSIPGRMEKPDEE
jgi:outer membrane protein OmpA-like peptidoglycan-associated protein